MTYSSNEIIEIGQKLYDETLKTKLESRFHGKMLALDIDSGKYAIGDDTLSAFTRLKESDPDGIVYLLRVGHAAAVTLGAESIR